MADERERRVGTNHADPAQYQRFLEAAHFLGCDDSEDVSVPGQEIP